MDVTGDWNLTFELRSGPGERQEKGVYLDEVQLTQTALAETAKEYFQHTSTGATI